MKKLTLLLLILSFLCASFCFAEQRPKLVVVLVVDQFRADYLLRFRSGFLPARIKGGVGGFNYLLETGAYFPFGRHELAQSMTAPGHASILTGAYPYQSGIPLNNWYNRSTRQVEIPTYDSASPLVGTDRKGGASPKNLVASTFGDELKNAGYSSRVISIAIKETPSILLGGHRADLALWYEPKSHQWISSRHYLPNSKLPNWVQDLNTRMKPELTRPIRWERPKTISGFSDEGTFPHTAQVGEPQASRTPFGLEMTRRAAEKAISGYRLGNGKATDLLALSFSSFDSAGHDFGPNSLEMEEMTYALDRELSLLFNFISKHVRGGFKNILIVLTGDHGVAPIPKWAESYKIKAGVLDEEVLSQKMNEYLNGLYGRPKEGSWIELIMNFNVYLNEKAIEDRKLKISEVQAAVKAFIQKDERVAYVVTSSEIVSRMLPIGIREKQFVHSFYHGRSGDIILLFKPYIIPKGLTGAPANHITGYSYDNTVPILFSGVGIRAGRFSTPAESVDIAPTLSFLSGVIPPSLSEGRVLSEILK